MKIKILSCDSFSVRSMATLVNEIFIDPGAALGPKRFGLPPSPQEVEELEKSLERIRKAMKKAKYVVITHYHYDHYIPDEPDIYHNKTLFLKDWERNINASQRSRARAFLKSLEKVDVKIEKALGKKKAGKYTLEFHEAFHGEKNSKLGKVAMCFVKEAKFVHASDVQGPMLSSPVKWILRKKPRIVFLSGFPIVFLYRYGNKKLEEARKNVRKLVKTVETVVVDHHLARMEKGIEIIHEDNAITAAEFMKKKLLLLEAHRKQLWELAKGKK